MKMWREEKTKGFQKMILLNETLRNSCFNTIKKFSYVLLPG